MRFWSTPQPSCSSTGKRHAISNARRRGWSVSAWPMSGPGSSTTPSGGVHSMSAFSNPSLTPSTTPGRQTVRRSSGWSSYRCRRWRTPDRRSRKGGYPVSSANIRVIDVPKQCPQRSAVGRSGASPRFCSCRCESPRGGAPTPPPWSPVRNTYSVLPLSRE